MSTLRMKYSVQKTADLVPFTSSLTSFVAKRQEKLSIVPKAGMAKISVIIPSYNQGEFLERTILSVINQGYSNTELIIIDGGSNDNSLEILKAYDSHISYWVSEPDQGQSDALNKGFSRATGNLMGWLNADDLYLPGVFAIIADEFEARQSVSVIFGDHLEIDKNDMVTDYMYAFDFSTKHFIYEGFHLNAQAMFWRSSLFQDFGVFDVRLHRTMDYDMILRFGIIAGESVFFRLEKPLACFRRHGAQKTQRYDEVVASEHAYIRSKYGIDSHKCIQLLWWYVFRARRFWWYLKRGGPHYLFTKLNGASVWR